MFAPPEGPAFTRDRNSHHGAKRKYTGFMRVESRARCQACCCRNRGQNLTGSFMDCSMSRADTMPRMEIFFNPVPTKRNPLGAKGAGEAGTVGALPAIVNAVLDALAPLGVKAFDMPATSERIWQASQEARA